MVAVKITIPREHAYAIKNFTRGLICGIFLIALIVLTSVGVNDYFGFTGKKAAIIDLLVVFFYAVLAGAYLLCYLEAKQRIEREDRIR